MKLAAILLAIASIVTLAVSLSNQSETGLVAAGVLMVGAAIFKDFRNP